MSNLAADYQPILGAATADATTRADATSRADEVNERLNALKLGGQQPLKAATQQQKLLPMQQQQVAALQSWAVTWGVYCRRTATKENQDGWFSLRANLSKEQPTDGMSSFARKSAVSSGTHKTKRNSPCRGDWNIHSSDWDILSNNWDNNDWDRSNTANNQDNYWGCWDSSNEVDLTNQLINESVHADDSCGGTPPVCMPTPVSSSCPEWSLTPRRPWVFGVLDGHGAGGRLASTKASQIFAEELGVRLQCHATPDPAAPDPPTPDPATPDPVSAESAALTSREQCKSKLMGMESALFYSFEKAQEKLLECNAVASRDFGTTAVVSACMGRYIVTATCGDSSAVLVCSVGPDIAVNVQLSVDHSLGSQSELNRIVNDGKGKVVVGDGGVHRLIPAFYSYEQAKTKGLSINMARALGHFVLSKCSLSPEPQLTLVDLVDVYQTLYELVQRKEEKNLSQLSDSRPNSRPDSREAGPGLITQQSAGLQSYLYEARNFRVILAQKFKDVKPSEFAHDQLPTLHTRTTTTGTELSAHENISDAAKVDNKKEDNQEEQKGEDRNGVGKKTEGAAEEEAQRRETNNDLDSFATQTTTASATQIDQNPTPSRTTTPAPITVPTPAPTERVGVEDGVLSRQVHSFDHKRSDCSDESRVVVVVEHSPSSADSNSCSADSSSWECSRFEADGRSNNRSNNRSSNRSNSRSKNSHEASNNRSNSRRKASANRSGKNETPCNHANSETNGKKESDTRLQKICPPTSADLGSPNTRYELLTPPPALQTSPTPAQETPAQRTPLQPTPAQPTPAQPTPAQPTTAQQTPSQQTSPNTTTRRRRRSQVERVEAPSPMTSWSMRVRESDKAPLDWTSPDAPESSEATESATDLDENLQNPQEKEKIERDAKLAEACTHAVKERSPDSPELTVCGQGKKGNGKGKAKSNEKANGGDEEDHGYGSGKENGRKMKPESVLKQEDSKKDPKEEDSRKEEPQWYEQCDIPATAEEITNFIHGSKLFLVLMSDGVSDVLSRQQVGEVVLHFNNDGKSAAEIADILTMKAGQIRRQKCFRADNCTSLVVQLQPCIDQ